jgi:hypothetical protein
MRPIGFPATSVTNYQFSLRNIAEEQRSYLYRAVRLTPLKAHPTRSWPEEGSWCPHLMRLSIVELNMLIGYLNSWFQIFAVFWILYLFFWVFSRRQVKFYRRFGTLCQVNLQRPWHGIYKHHALLSLFIFFILPLKMDLTEGSETSEKLNLTPGKYPKENIQAT